MSIHTLCYIYIYSGQATQMSYQLICKPNDYVGNNLISRPPSVPFSLAEGTRKTAYRSRYDFLIPGVDDIRIRSFLRLPAVRLAARFVTRDLSYSSFD